MKRYLALFLILILPLSGFAAAEQAPSVALQDAKQRILSDWFDYLFACENICADALWAIDAADEYIENPSWETKQKASMAVSVASLHIRLRELTERMAGMEDYYAFEDLGADAAFIPMELDSYASHNSSLQTNLLNVMTDLDFSAFLVTDLHSMQWNNDLLRRQQQLDLAYLKLTTEYILINLGEDEQTANLRDYIEKYCPGIHGAAEITDPTADGIIGEVTLLLDEIAAVEAEMGDLMLRQEESLALYADAAITGNWSVIQENATWIDGLPMLLPDPGWGAAEGSESNYYWLDESGSLFLPATRSDIDRIPDGCLFTYPNIPREEVLAYRDALSFMGLEPIDIKEADDSLSLYYVLGESTFAILWQGGNASLHMLENPLCLAPYWYIDAIAMMD